MTGNSHPTEESASRSATIRTAVADAAILAAAVRPDNTPEIDTRVEQGCAEDDGERTGVIVTEVERETTGGLRTTVDDYVVNLAVARDVVQAAKRHGSANADVTNADDTDNTQS